MTASSCHDEPAKSELSSSAARAVGTIVPKRPQIVLVGNPNVGKTTLFNALTGLSAKVSNYPGITVERRTGRLALPAGDADLHDLPGTYSLNARSAEEQIAFDAIAGLHGETAPDAAIVCLDATQLARSAYLLLQLRELGTRCVVALTMVDEAGASAPDAKRLRDVLDCEVVPVIAKAKKGLDELVAAVDRVLRSERRSHWVWKPSRSLQDHLDAVRAALPPGWRAETRFAAADGARPADDKRPDDDKHAETDDTRAADHNRQADDAVALWAMTCIESNRDEGDELAGVPTDLRAAVAARATSDAIHREIDDAAVLGRWTWLDKELAAHAVRKSALKAHSRTARIDRILLHRVVGFAVFLGIMTILFMSLFAWADPLIDLIDSAFKSVGAQLRDLLGDGIFTDFLVDGVIAGVGAVMVFLPQILLLFLFLGFLEDCGYLARVAYLMDRIMRSMNLHGRAFVPMLFGFACAVPAIAATRTMERRRDRILTMMVVPLMTCSARLPVYTLLIGALIKGSRITQALLMVGMYLFSASTSLAAAWTMSKVVKPLKAKRLPFIIELPPYRFPRVFDVLRMMWSKSSMFLREAGTVILACSIALWALLYFPRELPKDAPDYAALIEKAPSTDEKHALEDEKQALLLHNSYGGRLGHVIEPVIRPLGFDWKIGIGIIGAFAAREVFVSTLGVVYAVGGESDERSEPLREALRKATKPDGTRAYTPLMALSLMVFFALAMQCMSTLAVVRRETGGFRWPAFLFGYMTVLAWVASFLVYQGGRLLGFG
ncbi:MAG TPA: ferrous iron transport protein B [Kofleriaceae bacterium]|nr:ferrous iron transport protein B [Kofleriaceae bacterium]